ncbi:MAG TPA: hypothetical protein VFM59_05260, partial [Salinimicrobium sp.]|nr:hypothetical protein [Salinimicrobium sp.]
SLESNLLKIVEIFAEEAESAEVFEKIGDFFLGKQKKEQALEYFQRGLQNSDSNYGLIMKTLPLQQEFQKYEEAKVLIENAIENYPSQPLLYLENGRILNQLTKNKEAIDMLTFGLDFIIENPEMEVRFYEEIASAYSGLKNETKAAEFRKKAAQLKPSGPNE